MLKEIDIIISKETPDIANRFDDNSEILQKVEVLDKTTEDLIWQVLNQGIILESYSLNHENFENFEEIDFGDNYGKITQRFNEIFIEAEKIVLTYFSSQHSLYIDSGTFQKYWDDFFTPSADDLIIINLKWNWIKYIAHYEVFQFGQNIKNM